MRLGARERASKSHTLTVRSSETETARLPSHSRNTIDPCRVAQEGAQGAAQFRIPYLDRTVLEAETIQRPSALMATLADRACMADEAR